MLGELEGEGRWVIGDMEAGLGMLLRSDEGALDVVLAVAQNTAKSLDVAGRVARVGANRGARVIVVANRVRSPDDVEAISAAFPGLEVVAVPEDDHVAAADRDGRAPLDVNGTGPAIAALAGLAERIAPLQV